MPVKKKNATKKKSVKLKGTNELPSQVSGTVAVSYQAAPVKSGNRQIDLRQKLPPIKQGKKISDETPTPPLKIEDC